MSDKRNSRLVIWQGWHLQLPRRWDPIKLEGDHTEGYALFADTLRPRLGLRWQTPKQNRKFDPEKSVRLAMRNEVGQLAADEAVIKGSLPFMSANDDRLWDSPLLYVEPEPPGRDLFAVFSEVSGRLLTLAYHAHRREQILESTILPTLADLPVDRAVPWSIFDLNCVIPGGMKLVNRQLNAGDLGLTFADRYQQVTVRQIAVAKLALQRQSLDGWITEQQRINRKYYLPTGQFSDITLTINGKDLAARISRCHRRLRYAMLWQLPRELIAIAAHDADRDRLVILHGSDQSLLTEIAQTVGSI